MHDVVETARGRPRDLLIPEPDDFMCVFEFVEVRLQHARQGAVRLARAGRVDMNGEILAGRVSGERERITGERTGTLDRIAVRPVERSGDRTILLLEDEL